MDRIYIASTKFLFNKKNNLKIKIRYLVMAESEEKARGILKKAWPNESKNGFFGLPNTGSTPNLWGDKDLSDFIETKNPCYEFKELRVKKFLQLEKILTYWKTIPGHKAAKNKGIQFD